MANYAIIVAGGSGNRMESDIPKQFLLLKGKPLLMHTIEAFYNSDPSTMIIVVLNVDFHTYWEELCKKYQFDVPHQMVRAGQHRFHSVKNGLKAVKGAAVVAIHDAVRPLVSSRLIKEGFEHASKFGTAVAAVKSRDSVRQSGRDGSVAINRDDIWLIQTPQTFQTNILNKAYKQDYRNEFTDDASVVERTGTRIHLIEGDNKNFKITFPEDIRLAEMYLDLEY